MFTQSHKERSRAYNTQLEEGWVEWMVGGWTTRLGRAHFVLLSQDTWG